MAERSQTQALRRARSRIKPSPVRRSGHGMQLSENELRTRTISNVRDQPRARRGHPTHEVTDAQEAYPSLLCRMPKDPEPLARQQSIRCRCNPDRTRASLDLADAAPWPSVRKAMSGHCPGDVRTRSRRLVAPARRFLLHPTVHHLSLRELSVRNGFMRWGLHGLLSDRQNRQSFPAQVVSCGG